MITQLQKEAVNTIFNQREHFIIIGLTGKIGSGCSTVAKQCSKPFRELKLSCPQPNSDKRWLDEERDSRIVQRFYSHHMQDKSFYVIKVRDVILSFVFEEYETINRFSRDVESGRSDKPTKKIQTIIQEAIEEYLNKNTGKGRFCEYWNNIQMKNDLDGEEKEDRAIKCLVKVNQLITETDTEKGVVRYEYIYNVLPFLGAKIHEEIKESYTKIFQGYGNELRFFGTLNSLNWENSVKNDMNFYTIAKRINYFIKALEYRKGEKKEITFVVIDSMKNIYESTYLKDRYSSYYLISVSKEEMLRKEEIRRSKPYYSEEEIQVLDYNERPNEARKKFKKFINIAYEKTGKEEGWKKNGIEYIIQGKYSEFLNFYQKSIGEQKKKIEVNWSTEFQTAGITEELFKYYRTILCDPLRVFMYYAKLHQMYLQDVESCIQNADIFLTNNETSEEPHKLNLSLVRYISLMMHPGLVTPTAVERCMQIAYAAKVNSGCISRQVGSVVTDKEYNILSLGWNDVPCGQVSCNRRNLFDLARALDQLAFSDYENGPRTAFREEINSYHLDKCSPNRIVDVLKGLPAAFCFKDIQEHITGDKNPMEARSMHGEEKALLACDQQRVKGGYLFTTSSPCVMCAKNAKDHFISKIYYIEPYPGISQMHVCDSGEKNNRAQYVLFEGAIGRAYTQLYTPVMPYKDELKLRGIDELKQKENTPIMDDYNFTD